MKKYFFLLFFLCVLQVTAQREYDQVDIPFYNRKNIEKQLLQKNGYDTIWLPMRVVEHVHSLDTFFVYDYEYHESGLLKKWVNRYDFGEEHYIYNCTFTTPSEDILDTVLFFQYGENHELIPYQRVCYENRQDQADNPYQAYDEQVWSNGKWITTFRKEYFLLDTLQQVKGFRYRHNMYNDGVQTYGRHRYLTFDEFGNVKHIINKAYDPETGNYEDISWHEYFYDENNICNEFKYYMNYGNGFELHHKISWEWEEYHGFLNGDYLYHEVHEFGININRPNKFRTMTVWEYQNGWKFHRTEKMQWNIDGNESANEYTYRYSEAFDSLYVDKIRELYFDTQKNIEKRMSMSKYSPDYYGPNHDTLLFNCYTYGNAYDNHNRLYLYELYLSNIDNIFYDEPYYDQWISTYVVDSFTYVLKPVGFETIEPKTESTLKIIPNPNNRQFTVFSQEEIRRIDIYSLEGRKVYEKSHSGKEVKFDLGYLPSGGYILKTFFKNGTAQSEKFLIQL